MPFLEQQAAAMSTSLAETQDANAALLPVVTAQRAEIEALVRGLEGVVADLEASAAIMAQDDVQGLGADIRQIEKQMRT
jgi:kinetochore protein NNF1